MPNAKDTHEPTTTTFFPGRPGSGFGPQTPFLGMALKKSIKLLPPPWHVGEQTCRRRRDSRPERRRANKMERKQRRRLLRVQEQRSNERGSLLYSVFLSGRIYSERQKKAKAPLGGRSKRTFRVKGRGWLKNCLLLRNAGSGVQKQLKFCGRNSWTPSNGVIHLARDAWLHPACLSNSTK